MDVVELTRATLDAMRPEFEEAEVELEVGAGLEPAVGDRDRIQQVLVNLLDNAVKYGGGGRVIVRIDRSAAGVRIAVEDAGPGIPPADLERIFDKFYRGDPDLTRAPSGTGLGLYISRELVRRMGGRVDVRSEPGAGATFVVELPRA